MVCKYYYAPRNSSILKLLLLNCFRNKVEKILVHVTSTKVYGQYAKAREADKKYAESAKAYEVAKDYENAIR